MANESTVFPQIIRPTYDPSDAFPKMVSDAKNAARQIKGEFDSATGKIFKTDAQSGVFAGMAREASQLRAALDPLYAAQQRFNQAMDSTDNLFRSGIISQREHVSATRLYREELQRANAALFANANAQKLAQSVPTGRIRQATGAERLVAGDASIDRAALAATTLDQVLARVATKGPQVQAALTSAAKASAAAMDEANRAAQKLAQSLEAEAAKAARELALETDRLAKEAAILRGQLDPLYVAQVRFDQEMNRADDLLRAGTISQREYAMATQASRDALQQANAAIHGVAEGARAGTTANHLMANSTRGLRQASVQAGQQLQDIAISIYSGQRASVVFAQQLPQLAFALTSLEGSTNKTLSKIGTFATFLSGPWGLAVGLAVGALGMLASEYFSAGEASDKAKNKSYDFAKALDVTKLSAEQLVDAMKQLVEETERAIQSQDALVDSRANNAKISEAQARSELARINAALSEANKANTFVGRQIGTAPAPGVIEALEAKAKQLNDVISNAKVASVNAQIAQTQRNVAESLDETTAAQGRYNREVAKLIELRQKYEDVPLGGRQAGIDQAEFDNRYKALTRAYEAEKKLLSQRKQNVKNVRGDLVDIGLPFSASKISSGYGARVAPTKGASTNHLGVDFAMAEGTPIRATMDGIVQFARNIRGYGNQLRLGLGAGTEQRFSHLSKFNVDEGQKVSKGDILGFVGKTGTATGSHLHYEVLVNGKKVDPTKRLFGVDSGYVEKTGDAAERKAAQAAEAAQRLAEFGRDARVQIEQMKSALAETPPALQAAARETERLDDLAASIRDKLPAGATEMLAEIEKLKVAAQELADGPFRDMLKSAAERAEIEKVLIEGGEFEAEVKRRVLDLERQQGALDEKRINTIRAIVLEERARARLIEKQEVARRRELDYLEQTQNNIRQTTYELLKGDGFKAIGNLFKRQFDLVVQQMADSITESLFGDAFRDAKDKAMGFDKVKEASLRVAASSNIAADALNALADAAHNASGAMDPANDNEHDVAKQVAEISDEIIVTARSMRETLKDTLNRIGKSLLGDKFFTKMQGLLKGGMEAVAYGQFGSGILRSVGVKQSKTGASIGGLAGGVIGGPVGAIIGGIIGGTIGGLFKKTPKGNVVISNSGTTVSGSSKLSSGLQSLGSGVSDTLSSIAEQLGGTVGGYSVSVRQKGKKYYVNGQKFKDPEEAARAALLSAIQNGAVQGITQGAQNLLRAGQDVEKQLSKAVKFQNVFKELRSLKDPVGAAITELNNEFTSLISIFNEAGASAQEFADLEELYGLKRAEAIKSATEQMTGALKSLIDEMTIGDNGLSLRDRLANARAAFNPLASDVQSGKKVDYDAFAEAARALLDVQRQLSGSGGDYFKTFNEILSLSQTALAGQQNVVSIASAAGSPFAGVSTAEAVYSPIVGALNDQSQMMLVQLLSLNTTSQKLVDAMNAANANGTGFYANYATGTTYF